MKRWDRRTWRRKGEHYIYSCRTSVTVCMDDQLFIQLVEQVRGMLGEIEVSADHGSRWEHHTSPDQWFIVAGCLEEADYHVAT